MIHGLNPYLNIYSENVSDLTMLQSFEQYMDQICIITILLIIFLPFWSRAGTCTDIFPGGATSTSARGACENFIALHLDLEPGGAL